MVNIEEYWLTFALGTLLPALVALVTKQNAASWVKSLALAALSAVSGVLTSVAANGGQLEWKAALTSFIITFVTAVSTHYGLLKPSGVTGSEGAIAEAVPGGIGPVETGHDPVDPI